MSIQAWKCGKIVIISGYGQLKTSAWTDVTIGTGLPKSVITMRMPIACQDGIPQGSFMSINEYGTLNFEPKSSAYNNWIFFGGSYITSE